MSDLAHLTHEGAIPRGNWLFIMCGVSTILSGYFSGPPILISPESAPGIKAGARTGLSTLVCGLLYAVSVFLGPLFVKVPPSATSPLLILVGLTLFVNTGRIRWTSPDEAVPAFFVLLLIPFTYSILAGVGVGYVLYVLIGCGTGRLQRKVWLAFVRTDIRAGSGGGSERGVGVVSPRGPRNSSDTGSRDRDSGTSGVQLGAMGTMGTRETRESRDSGTFSFVFSPLKAQLEEGGRERGEGGGGGGGGGGDISHNSPISQATLSPTLRVNPSSTNSHNTNNSSEYSPSVTVNFAQPDSNAGTAGSTREDSESVERHRRRAITDSIPMDMTNSINSMQV
ncbi:hypothetical protein B484DRAFT_389263 [Ochromonadaceae sp. CCMP2298]|nr:hypothetical protein B484DRAFT_389263 [Ochromonadaceae sp. CCMP2298]